MNLEESLKLLDRLYHLIKRESTGTPAELASRLNKSVPTVHRYIHQLKAAGVPIEYCPYKESYYFTEQFNFKIM